MELTGGAVNVSSERGDINLASVMASDFVFGNISGAGGVNIKSERSVYGKDASSLIKGDGVTLQAAMGSIGKDGLAVNLDTNHLSASAQESVAIKNASSGDLGINLAPPEAVMLTSPEALLSKPFKIIFDLDELISKEEES